MGGEQATGDFEPELEVRAGARPKKPESSARSGRWRGTTACGAALAGRTLPVSRIPLKLVPGPKA